MNSQLAEPTPSILVITGASGSGKTSIVTALAARPHPGIRYHHFDSVGVPSTEEMAARHGSPEGWQRDVTREWIARLAGGSGYQLEVLEGQVRPGVAQDAFLANGISRRSMLLLDCSHEVRNARLHGPRAQPELATLQMTNWAAYLRGQADALHVPVIDTSELSFDQAVARVEQHVRSLQSNP